MSDQHDTINTTYSQLSGAVSDDLSQTEKLGATEYSLSKTSDAVPVRQLPERTDAEQAGLDVGVLSRAARDCFQSVMDEHSRGNVEAADAALSEAKDRIIELWPLAAFRAPPFRSLLGAVDAALRYHTVSEFNDTQLRCLMDAFRDLPRNGLLQDDVSKHMRAFAEHAVDVTGPLRGRPRSAVQITLSSADAG